MILCILSWAKNEKNIYTRCTKDELKIKKYEHEVKETIVKCCKYT